MVIKLKYKEPTLIAGVDEAGRGPLAGPVVAAAVILDPDKPILGIKDSKILSPKNRELLAQKIKQNALAWSVQCADVDEIEQLNIHHATLLAMKRAVESLHIMPDLAQMDGKFCPNLPCLAEAIIDGDFIIPVIGAASILAKVHRDEYMIALHQQYPEYGFDEHKGYATKKHLFALKQFGISPVHRKGFAPIKALLGSY